MLKIILKLPWASSDTVVRALCRGKRIVSGEKYRLVSRIQFSNKVLKSRNYRCLIGCLILLATEMRLS